jgi:hypothetical protein
MSIPRVVALTAIALSAAACSSDVVGPADPGFALGGEWSYVANELSAQFFDETVTCEYRFDMRLTITGETFGGTYRRALMTCFLFGETQPVEAGSGEIVGGMLSGDAVQFDVDTDGIRNIGTLTAEGMSGNVSIKLVVQHDADIDTIFVTGPWTASR